MAELVTSKAIIAGDTIEIYTYGKGYKKGYRDTINKSGRRKAYTSLEYEENRRKTLQRAKAKLRRTINANYMQYGKKFTSKFMTLTFAENITDIKTANYEFKKFIQRLNYYIFKTKKSNLKYSAVIEFQDRGAVHYHLAIYNMPFVSAKKINEIWDIGMQGNINIQKIKDSTHVGSYLCKYMSKGNGDPRLEGYKCYFNSRGLLKPEEITDKKRVEALLQALPLKHLKCSFTFDNEHIGKTTYYQFNINYVNNDMPFGDLTFGKLREA